MVSVGEPINCEAWEWLHRVVGDSRCTLVDTWWQTGEEAWGTGSSLSAGSAGTGVRLGLGSELSTAGATEDTSTPETAETLGARVRELRGRVAAVSQLWALMSRLL